MQSKYFKMEP